MYRIRLAAVPTEGPVTVIELDRHRQHILEHFSQYLLEDRHWEAIDAAVAETLANVLVQELESG